VSGRETSGIVSGRETQTTRERCQFMEKIPCNAKNCDEKNLKKKKKKVIRKIWHNFLRTLHTGNKKLIFHVELKKHAIRNLKI
jgi:hypothetical protein